MSWATANEQVVAVFLQRSYLRRVLVPMPVLVRDTARWVVSMDSELPVGAEEPVTTTVTRRIKPGHEAAYEAFLAGISNAARADWSCLVASNWTLAADQHPATVAA